MLSLSKSILNGIGSASGVAWPSFGIVCALLGASIGGPISLGLAISSVFLFFTVGTPIIYFSYQDSQNQQRQLLKQNLYHQQRLFESINHYLQRIKEHHLKEKSSFTYPQYLQIIINKDLNLLAIKESKSPLYRLLVILKDHTQDDILNRRIIFESINSTYPRHPIAKSQLLIPAFYGFVGT
ncbi:MAG: hypothetical protein PSV35_05195, partial [bacterium]|nr:hypothetical protein [bacterium]